MELSKMTVEELLQPVMIDTDVSLAEQFKKLAEEQQELGEELKTYYDAALKIAEGSADKALKFETHAALQRAAIEAGDVMIAAAKLIDMLGYRLPSVLQTCYNKNAARGYYTVNTEDE